MLTRTIRSALVGCTSIGLLLGWGGATEAEAQLRDLGFTAYTGASFPVGQFADYLKGGPAFGIQLEYPLREPVDLFLNADVDLLNGNARYGIPDFDLYRYQAGIEADLLGRGSDRWGLRGQLGAGATSFKSRTFYLNNSATPYDFRHTYVTGTAGLKFVFGSGPVHGYLGSRLHFVPMKEEHTQVLRDKTNAAVDALGTSLSVPVTLGLRIRTS